MSRRVGEIKSSVRPEGVNRKQISSTACVVKNRPELTECDNKRYKPSDILDAKSRGQRQEQRNDDAILEE